MFNRSNTIFQIKLNKLMLVFQDAKRSRNRVMLLHRQILDKAQKSRLHENDLPEALVVHWLQALDLQCLGCHGDVKHSAVIQGVKLTS